MCDAILRLVRDMLKFRLRESLGGGLRVRFTWVSRNRGLTLCPHPAFPLGFRHRPTSASGSAMALMPRDDLPKLCFKGPSPGRLLGVRVRNGEGQAPGSVLGVLSVWPGPQLRPRWSMPRSLLRVRLGNMGSDLEGKGEKGEGMVQMKGERKARSRGSSRGSDAIRRFLLTREREGQSEG